MKSFLERWRDIEGYEGLYQVSDFGDVRSLGMVVGRGKGYFKKGRVLKPVKHRDGYLKVNLYKNGKMKTHLLHRLVAQAFIPNPDNLPEINHIDENKENNKVCSGMVNLEWCTSKYNSNYGTHIQRVADKLRGVKRPYMLEILRNDPRQSKKVLQLTLDGTLVKEWPSISECGRNGFDKGTVSDCCRGKCKTHKGYRFVFAEDYYKEAVA